MRILITGGAGFLGSALAKAILRDTPDATVIIYSRDEGKQQAMRADVPEGGATGARYMLGDICDHERLRMAMRGVDQVYHCAAMKCIDACEYDSMEAVRVNVDGTRSVIRACIMENVKRAVYIGTDKGVNPVGIYGKTKGLAESMWIQANTYGMCEFVGVRYGNVAGAAKSVFHTWAKLRKEGKRIPVTNSCATRYFWHVDDAVSFVRGVMDGQVQRGCIAIPHMESYSMITIAQKYGHFDEVGWRCPEKECEELVSENELFRSTKEYFVVYPVCHSWGDIEMAGREEYSGSMRSDYSVCYDIPAYLLPEAYGA